VSQTIRERIADLKAMNAGELGARLAVLNRLAMGAASELIHIWRKYPAGELRARKQRDCAEFWRHFWAVLRHHLESSADAAAVELIDVALDRVEPATARGETCAD